MSAGFFKNPLLRNYPSLQHALSFPYLMLIAVSGLSLVLFIFPVLINQKKPDCFYAIRDSTIILLNELQSCVCFLPLLYSGGLM